MQHVWQNRILLFVIGLSFLTARDATVPLRAADHEPGSSTSTEAALPLPGDGAKPTISLSATTAEPATSVIASGKSVDGAPVRVAYLSPEQSVTVAVVTPDANGSYSASIPIPADETARQTQVCAALTGREVAPFACAALTIADPPPLDVTGTVPIPAGASLREPRAGQAINGSIGFANLKTSEISYVSVNPSGSFTANGLAPGSYSTSGCGQYPGHLTASGGDALRIADKVYLNGSNVAISRNGVSIPRTRAADPVVLTPKLVRAEEIGAPFADLAKYGTIADLVVEGANVILPRPAGSQFTEYGHFISGVTLVFTVTMCFQYTPSANPRGVDVTLYSLDGKKQFSLAKAKNAANGFGLETTINVGQLQPGRWWLEACATNEVGQPTAGCAAVYLNAYKNPLDPALFPSATMAAVKNGNRYEYHFRGNYAGDVNGGQQRPFPDPPPNVARLGTLANSSNLGQTVEGIIKQDGTTYLRKAANDVQSTIMSKPRANEIESFVDSAVELGNGIANRNLAISTGRQEIPLFKFGQDFPKTPIFSFLGIVTLSFQMGFSSEGKLFYEVVFKPLIPSLTAYLMPVITFSFYFDLVLDVLFGLVSASAGVELDFGFSMILRYLLDSPTKASDVVDAAGFDNPCFKLEVFLRLRIAALWGLFSKSYRSRLVDPVRIPSGCTSNDSPRTGSQDVPVSYLPAPSVASSPDGRMLGAYIENTAPTAATPTFQVMARFWQAGGTTWDSALPVSDPAWLTTDPVVAFAGPSATPIVAWTQTSVPYANMIESPTNTDQMIVTSIADGMKIWWSAWTGAAWSAPQQVTPDAVSEGRACLAGDSQGATLAFVRGVDADPANRSTRVIGVVQWEGVDPVSWGTIELLSGGPGQNRQVSCTRLATTTVTPALRGTFGNNCLHHKVLDANILPNGDAESNLGASDLVTVIAPECWQTSGNFGIVRYDQPSGLPQQPGGAASYFAGGPANAQSSARWELLLDTLEAPAIAGAIARGDATATLSGQIGGRVAQDDNAVVTVVFDNDSIPGFVPAVGTIGPILAADRLDESKLLPLTTTLPIPVGAVRATIIMTMTRVPGSTYNDGFADSLSLVIRSPRRSLAWVYDPDPNDQSPLDQRLMVADWKPGTGFWESRLTTLNEVPNGVESPSIALKPGDQRLNLAYLVRFQPPGVESVAQIGTNTALWTGSEQLLSGQLRIVSSRSEDPAEKPVNGQRPPILAESPKLTFDRIGRPSLVFRRFTQKGAASDAGQLMISSPLSLTTSLSFGALASDTTIQQQPSIAANQTNDRLIVLSVRSPIRGFAGATVSLPPATPRSARVRQADDLSPGPSTVQSLTLDQQPDPSLDPVLGLSESRATTGATVAVTATVRNLGQGAAAGLSVRFFAGTPLTGTLIATVPLAGPLGPNELTTQSITITAGSGLQPLSAVVVTTGTNASTANDSASGLLGALPAPERLVAQQSGLARNAVLLTWAPPEANGVAGYRVYRASSATGPFEFVGEATGGRFVDYQLGRGQTYFYLVRAYGTDGVASPSSTIASASTVAPDRTFIPAGRDEVPLG